MAFARHNYPKDLRCIMTPVDPLVVDTSTDIDIMLFQDLFLSSVCDECDSSRQDDSFIQAQSAVEPSRLRRRQVQDTIGWTLAVSQRNKRLVRVGEWALVVNGEVSRTTDLGDPEPWLGPGIEIAGAVFGS